MACLQVSTAGVFSFFFNDTATTEIYTLSLHDALPICELRGRIHARGGLANVFVLSGPLRSEEHTSELQSRQYLVCRLLLHKKQLLWSTWRGLPGQQSLPRLSRCSGWL